VSGDTGGISCNNPECRVTETGKCVEGLTLDKCSHVVGSASLADEASIGSSDDPLGAAPTVDLQLPKAERLELSEASAILRAAPSRLIAIVGPTSSGKTSLIASLCNLFQKGPVGTLCFARSRTIFAFEQACHHARAASRRNTPQTEHTHLGSGVGFYHLGLMDDGSFIQLMLADRPGEDYRSVADDPTNASEFVEIRRADSILVMVNGELLLDLTARHNARNDTLMILQGLKDGDVLSKSQRLAVVLTKLDIIQSAQPAEHDRALRDFDGIVNLIRARFGQVFHEILPFKIAASPATEILPYAYGSDELLKFWVEPQIAADPKLLPKTQSARAMGRYGMADSRSYS
jgi:Double-GTPase 2